MSRRGIELHRVREPGRRVSAVADGACHPPNRRSGGKATARPPMTAHRAPMASRSAAACPRTASTDCICPTRVPAAAGDCPPRRSAYGATPAPWPRSPHPRPTGSRAAFSAGTFAPRRRTGRRPPGTSQHQQRPRHHSKRRQAIRPAWTRCLHAGLMAAPPGELCSLDPEQVTPLVTYLCTETMSLASEMIRFD